MNAKLQVKVGVVIDECGTEKWWAAIPDQGEPMVLVWADSEVKARLVAVAMYEELCIRYKPASFDQTKEV